MKIAKNKQNNNQAAIVFSAYRCLLYASLSGCYRIDNGFEIIFIVFCKIKS